VIAISLPLPNRAVAQDAVPRRAGEHHMILPDPSAVLALARAVSAAADSASVHAAIARAAVEALGARVARVWVNDASQRALVAMGSHGVEVELERSLLQSVTLPHGAGVPGSVFARVERTFIDDAQDDARWVNSRYIRALGLRGYMGLPMVAGDVPVGVLSILFGTPRAFTDAERTSAGLLADCGAVAIGIAQMYEERRQTVALEAVKRIANATAHELNGPLSVVLGNLQLLDMDIADAALHARIERALAAGRRMAEVVERMQRIVRLESARDTGPHLPDMLDIDRSVGE
jgi:GAF domain-containing protein